MGPGNTQVKAISPEGGERPAEVSAAALGPCQALQYPPHAAAPALGDVSSGLSGTKL